MIPLGMGGTRCTSRRGVPDVHRGGGYPMYISEGVPDVHQGRGYPMYTFFSKPGLERTTVIL